MEYNYRTAGTCAMQINFALNDGKVNGVEFIGGCNGNLKAISTLIDGWDAKDVIAKLKGNTCGFKATSCADQLAIALEQALANESK